MREIFDTYGQAILASIGALAILSLIMFFMFGDGTTAGPLTQSMYDTIESILP